MASIKIRQRKDGVFAFQITVSLGRDEAGKKIFSTTKFIAKSKSETKAIKEAETFAIEFENKTRNGDVVKDDNISFEGFTQIWERNWLSAKSPRTQENYQDIIKNRVLPSIGKKKLVEIKAPHIDAIIKHEQLDLGWSPQTIKTTFTVINTVFKYALKKQYISVNPCARCDDLPSLATKTGNDISFFTEEQTKRFLKDALNLEYTYTVKAHTCVNKKTGKTYTVKDYTETRKVPLQWKIYFTMAIYGQFRREEMCALTWKDIDTDAEVISINKAMIYTRKKGQFTKEPKTKAGIRDIVMPPVLFDMLREWKNELMTLCVQMGPEWKGHRNGKVVRNGKEELDSFDDNNVFIQVKNGKYGLPVSISTPSHKFLEILGYYNNSIEDEEKKLPLIRLHDLRHTGATLLLANHTDIETVSRRLGHSRASVTLDIYGHALPDRDRKAAVTLGDLFEKKPDGNDNLASGE